MWTPSAISTIYPNSYSPASPVQPLADIPTQTTPASQTVTTVSTDHFTVQFTFPESADPGNTITISTTTTAKSSGQADNLSIEVLAYLNRQLAKTTSTTILTNQQVQSGKTWQTTLTVIIPPNADRSVMVGIVNETWEEISSYYNSYGYLPYYQSYPNSYPYQSYPNSYPYYPYNYVNEPPYATVQKSSQQTLPLTYVLATTPEYEQLYTQDKALRQEYDSLVATNNELASKYEALRSDHDQLTSKYNQLGSEYAATNSELNNFKTYTYVLIVAAIALAAAVVFLALGRRGTVERSAKQDK
jgi:hypothetical protein